MRHLRAVEGAASAALALAVLADVDVVVEEEDVVGPLPDAEADASLARGRGREAGLVAEPVLAARIRDGAGAVVADERHVAACADVLV